MSAPDSSREPFSQFHYDSFLPLGGFEVPFHLFRVILSFHPRYWRVEPEIPVATKYDPCSAAFALRYPRKENATLSNSEDLPIDESQEDSEKAEVSSESHPLPPLTYRASFLHSIGAVCSSWRSACLASFETILICPARGILPSCYPPTCLRFAETLALQFEDCTPCDCQYGTRLPQSEIEILLRGLFGETEIEERGRMTATTFLKRIVVGNEKMVGYLAPLRWWKMADPTKVVARHQMDCPNASEGATVSHPADMVTPIEMLVDIARVAKEQERVFPDVLSVFRSYRCVFSSEFPPWKLPDFSEADCEALRGVFPRVQVASLGVAFLKGLVWSDTLQSLKILKVPLHIVSELFRSYSQVRKLSGVFLEGDFAPMIHLLSSRIPTVKSVQFVVNVRARMNLMRSRQVVENVETVCLRITEVNMDAHLGHVPEFLSGSNVRHVILRGFSPFHELKELSSESIVKILEISDRSVLIDLFRKKDQSPGWFPMTAERNAFTRREHSGRGIGNALVTSSGFAKKLRFDDDRWFNVEQPLEESNRLSHAIGISHLGMEAFLGLNVMRGFDTARIIIVSKNDEPFSAPEEWDLRNFVRGGFVENSDSVCFIRDPFMNISTISLLHVADSATVDLITFVGVIFAGHMSPPLPAARMASFQTPAFVALTEFLQIRGYVLDQLDEFSEQEEAVQRWKEWSRMAVDRRQWKIRVPGCVSCVWRRNTGTECPEKRIGYPSSLTLEFMLRMVSALKQRATALMLSQRNEDALKILKEARGGARYVRVLMPTTRDREIDLAVALNISLCYLRMKKYRDCLLACRELLQYRGAQMTPVQTAKVYCRRGRCWEAFGKIENAISQYEQALECSKECSVATSRLARLRPADS